MEPKKQGQMNAPAIMPMTKTGLARYYCIGYHLFLKKLSEVPEIRIIPGRQTFMPKEVQKIKEYFE